jgi:peptidyl-prolyl cis-trans isomerase SurA
MIVRKQARFTTRCREAVKMVSAWRVGLKKRLLMRCLPAALLAASTLLIPGCGKKDSGDDVGAVVDGHKIYRTEVDNLYQNQIAGSQQPPSGEQAASLRLNILESLIEDQILMQRAEKLGLLATDDEVERKLSEYKAPYTNEQFEARLREKKMTLDDFKRDIRRSITMEKVINKEVNSKVNVSDQDIVDYYNSHKSEFNFIEPRYHLAQIFVTPMPNPQLANQTNKAQNEPDARKKIQVVLNRLDSGDDFGTLAMNFSEDTETASNGGDLGFTFESALRNTDAGTRDAVMILKPGQYTPPIAVVNPMNKQLMGFRIVKLLARDPAGQRELSDPRVQQEIRSQLRDRREQLLKAAYYEVVRNQAKVENFYAQKVIDSNGAGAVIAK